MADTTSLKIVLLGNTGSGKSSLANTLFGEDVFPVCDLRSSNFTRFKSESKTILGRSVRLIDAPGFFDTDPWSSELSPELLQVVSESSPGPHAFLLVLRPEEVTQPLKMALTLKYFSEEALKFTTVVFTHGEEQLPLGLTIEEFVEQHEDLKKLVQKCGGRCHVVDNQHWNNSQDRYRNNQHQLEQLLKSIDQTVRDNGNIYSNQLLQEIVHMDPDGERKALASVKAGILLGAFLGATQGAGPQCCLAASCASPDDEEAQAGGAENLRKTPEKFRPYPVRPKPGKSKAHKDSWSTGGFAAAAAGVGFVAGKLASRYDSPTAAVQDLTQLSIKVRIMFEELTKAALAARDFVDAVRNK